MHRNSIALNTWNISNLYIHHRMAIKKNSHLNVHNKINKYYSSLTWIQNNIKWNKIIKLKIVRKRPKQKNDQTTNMWSMPIACPIFTKTKIEMNRGAITQNHSH